MGGGGHGVRVDDREQLLGSVLSIHLSVAFSAQAQVDTLA